MNLQRLAYGVVSGRQFSEIKDFIEDGESLLDIGSGHGGLVYRLNKNGFRAEGIDVAETGVFDIPFKKFDGMNIPYETDSFDTAVLMYVLHHASDQVKLLNEAKRSAKKRILIFEDTPRNNFERYFTARHGEYYNRVYGLGNKALFRTKKEWERLFSLNGFLVKKADTMPFYDNILYPTTRTRFVLGSN